MHRLSSEHWNLDWQYSMSLIMIVIVPFFYYKFAELLVPFYLVALKLYSLHY